MRAPLAAEVARLKDALAPWGHGRGYLNFADAPADAATMFDAAAFDRLRAIRARVDPGRLLQPNHAIPDGG
jgi:FAD/FMN-containing dehydrogenase